MIKGCIIYTLYLEGQPHSIDVATSLYELLRGVTMPESLVDKVEAMEVTIELVDVGPYDEKWSYESYKDQLDRSLVTDMKPGIFHHPRDYVTMINAFTSYDYNACRDWPWRTSMPEDLDEGTYCFGCYDLDKWGIVNNASQLGVSILSTDQAVNLVVLSNIYDATGLKQRPAAKEVVIEKNMYYVTFLVSNDDNIAFNL